MRFNGDRGGMEIPFREENIVVGRLLEVDFSTFSIIVDQCDTSAIRDDSNRGDRA